MPEPTTNSDTTDASTKDNPYKAHGFDTRKEYLEDLANEYDIPEYMVFAVADLLGPNEDFDGLINELEDLPDCF
jgi:hypothetical protein